MMIGFAPPLSFGHFPRDRGQPGPLAAPFTLTCLPFLISRWEGPLHNPRHSGESRNPEGRGNGANCGKRVVANPFGALCKYPWEGDVKAGVGGGDGSFGCLVGRGRFETCPYECRGLRRSQRASRGPSPLDSGFRRNDVSGHPGDDVDRRNDVSGRYGVEGRLDDNEGWCYGF